MRAAIDVNNREEAHAVQRSIEDPLMRTVLIMNGLLQALETVQARELTLHLLNALNEPQFGLTPPRTGANGNLGRIHDAGSSPD